MVHEATPLEIAQGLAKQGLQILPAKYRHKTPTVRWRTYQDRSTLMMLPTWFGGKGLRNYWCLAGRPSNAIIIDADSEAADAWWRQFLGEDVIESAARVVTQKGHHYWFRIPADWPDTKPIPSWSVHRQSDDLQFDVRGDGTGVLVPPSVHESGHVYAWEVPLEDAADAPLALLDGTAKRAANEGNGDTEGGGGAIRGTGGNMRSMLSRLLNNPPSEGGRNDWLAKVAGHYAKTYHGHEDLFTAHVQAANRMMDPPLDPAEFDKTIQSIWTSEHANNAQRGVFESEAGWLISGDYMIHTQIKIKGEDDKFVFDMGEYADFDLRAKGVMLAEDHSRTYWVQIVRRVRGSTSTEVIDAVLPGQVCGDDHAFRKWLAKFACTVNPPENMYPKQGSMGVRLQRYLEAQKPTVVKVTSTLGWDDEILDGDGGFVTHDGVITGDKVLTSEQAGVKPNPTLLVGGTAPHKYGFEQDLAEAQRVLKEVMAFHDPMVTAVFGAWWAACLVKPQIEQNTSLFPFIAIEAPSESGKTNGFFELMTQLNGNTRGEIQPTRAALRDMTAAHRNGIVWIDDLDDPTYLMELLRAATSGGSLTKMGEDRESIKNAQIVAPIVISGESLGMGTQKALIDRAVSLKVASPTGRKSVHDPNRPQWDDVLALRDIYPEGLSVLAGWLLQRALSAQPQVLAALREGRAEKSGRMADKVGIIRAGARLIDYLMATTPKDEKQAWQGGGDTAEQVEKWVALADSQGIGTDENTLTLEILPWALRTFDYPDRPKAGHGNELDTPVFVKNWDEQFAAVQSQIEELSTPPTEIWFSTALLSQSFEREYRRVDRRTQTEKALRDQADALKAPSKRFKITGGNGRLAYYRMVSGDVADRIMERAQGK